LSQVPQGVRVSLRLAKSLVNSLLRNNDDQFPPGVQQIDEDTTTVTLHLDSSQVADKVIHLRGLELLLRRKYRPQLIQTYPASPGIYSSSISISQYLDGHWVGLVKRQVEVTIQ
jgi:hypothetical protein